MTIPDSSWLKFWEFFAATGFIIVIVGVICEGGELFIKWAKKRKFRERLDKTSRREVVFLAKIIRLKILEVETIAFALMVFGLGVEFWGSHKVELIADEQSRKLEHKITDADARNLPIQSVLGRIRVEVKPPSSDFATNLHLRPIYQNPPMPLSDDDELKKQDKSFIQLGKQTDEDFASLIPVEGWIGSIRYFEGISKTTDGDIRFDIFFDSNKGGSPVWNPKGVTFNELNFAQFWISNEWPPPKGIVGGQIDLLVNGLWQKSFSIMPQTNKTFPYRVTATNLIQSPQN